jgi:hypothetical protein
MAYPGDQKFAQILSLSVGGLVGPENVVMGAVVAEKTPQEILAEAAKARQEASRFRRASLVISDEVVVESLKARASELETLAAMLEAQAANTAAR